MGIPTSVQENQQFQNMFGVSCLMIFGARMDILFTFKAKILVLIELVVI